MSVELISHKRINDAVVNNNFRFQYQINIPTGINSSKIEKKEWTYDMYFGYTHSGQHNFVEPDLIYNNRIISISDIQSILDYECDLRYTRMQPYITPCLFIDSSVCMKYIKKIENEFRYCSTFRLQYMVQNPVLKNLKNGCFSNLGLYHRIDLYIPDSTNKTRLIPLPPPFLQNINDYVSFSILVDEQNNLHYNNSLYSLTILATKYWNFVVQHEDDGIVVIDINDNASYYRYIQLLDMIAGTHNKLRELVSESEFDIRFPKQIIRKEYYDYLKSVQNSTKKLSN